MNFSLYVTCLNSIKMERGCGKDGSVDNLEFGVNVMGPIPIPKLHFV